VSQQETLELKRLRKDFKGDYRVMRVVMASSNPIDTLHMIRTGQYSVRTFLDMLEMLDVKVTIDEAETIRIKNNQQK
jgi:hypothetical protein